MGGFKNSNSGETKHLHARVKENYTDKDKGHSNHQNLYLFIIKNKILLTFPKAKKRENIFESNGKKLLSREAFS
jgi:hypothetical protein